VAHPVKHPVWPPGAHAGFEWMYAAVLGRLSVAAGGGGTGGGGSHGTAFNMLQLGMGASASATLEAWVEAFPLVSLVVVDPLAAADTTLDLGAGANGHPRKVQVQAAALQDAAGLERVATAHWPLHVVVDMEGRAAEDQLTAFRTIWPTIAPGGTCAHTRASCVCCAAVSARPTLCHACTCHAAASRVVMSCCVTFRDVVCPLCCLSLLCVVVACRRRVCVCVCVCVCVVVLCRVPSCHRRVPLVSSQVSTSPPTP